MSVSFTIFIHLYIIGKKLDIDIKFLKNRNQFIYANLEHTRWANTTQLSSTAKSDKAVV